VTPFLENNTLLVDTEKEVEDEKALSTEYYVGY
jgi:hypothetical protein